MEGELETELCMAALCKQLGNMWSEDDEVVVEGNIPIEKQREIRLTLLGKLYSKPNVTFKPS